MSSREFAEWMAYYQIEPFGPAREDHRAGVIAAAAGNAGRLAAMAHPGVRLDGKPYTAETFFPIGDERPGRDELRTKLKAWAKAMGVSSGNDKKPAPVDDCKKHGRRGFFATDGQSPRQRKKQG